MGSSWIIDVSAELAYLAGALVHGSSSCLFCAALGVIPLLRSPTPCGHTLERLSVEDNVFLARLVGLCLLGLDRQAIISSSSRLRAILPSRTLPVRRLR